MTVSSVLDEQSGEVAGIQDTVANLRAAIGTTLAGALLISALTTTFLGSNQNNPDIPPQLASKAQVELAGVSRSCPTRLLASGCPVASTPSSRR